MTRIIDTVNQNLHSLTAPENRLLEDEYINENDGLIYCSNCHTPRQKRIESPYVKMIPTIKCKCQQELYKAEQKEREKQEFLLEVSRLKSAGLQDKELHRYNFANDSGINPEIRHAHTYVEHWDEMKAQNTGLLLWGDVGTGKSFIAGCIANALLDRCVPVMMTNFARILNTLTGMYADDRNTYIDSLNRYALLIIDDLGMERNSEFAHEQVFNVIDSRYRSGKPLIVTTNLSLEELSNNPDLAKRRIYDRILERCVPLKVNNQNIRQMNAKIQLQQAKQLFR